MSPGSRDAATVEIAVEVEDDTPVVYDTADDPTPSWIAAYAMGLVASDRQDAGRSELLTYVQGEPTAVRAAVRHLEDPTAGDATLRAGARELLEAAVSQVADAEPADT
jgi:hypothetical protein